VGPDAMLFALSAVKPSFLWLSVLAPFLPACIFRRIERLLSLFCSFKRLLSLSLLFIRAFAGLGLLGLATVLADLFVTKVRSVLFMLFVLELSSIAISHLL
jgi:hypothetical protein